MNRIEHNMQTGETVIIDLTPAEIAEIEARPAPPALIPLSITRRQCALGLLQMGLITADEAVAMAATATPPAMIDALIEALPSELARATARIDFAATEYERDNALIGQLVALQHGTDADTDAFFMLSSAI